MPTLCPACKGSRGVQPHKYYNTLKPDKKPSDLETEARRRRAFQSLPEPARACQALAGSGSGRLWQAGRLWRVPEPARACRACHKPCQTEPARPCQTQPARACQSLPARACQSLPEPAEPARACHGLPRPLPGLPRCRAWLASLLKGAASQYLNLRPPSKASPGFQEPPGLPSLLRAFWVQGVFLPEVLISASCAEHPSIFSSTFSIFEAFCVARPHASWPDPAPISIPHGTFSAMFVDHDDPCPAHATAVPTPHANGGEKLISTATEPVFAYPIKVARNSPTKPSAFHYASWFGHSVFSGPVVSSGNFVCSEGFGRNMKN